MTSMSLDDLTAPGGSLAGGAGLLNRDTCSWLDSMLACWRWSRIRRLPRWSGCDFLRDRLLRAGRVLHGAGGRLLRQTGTGLGNAVSDGAPQAALVEIRERVSELGPSFNHAVARAAGAAAAENGILVGGTDGRSTMTRRPSSPGRFDREVYPGCLTPAGGRAGQPFPYISGLSLSLGVLVREPDGSEERFARVKVPEVLPRFLLDRIAEARCCR